MSTSTRKRRAHKVETVYGDMFVRSLSGRERSEYMTLFIGEGRSRNPLEANQHLVAMALCSSEGAPLFHSFEAAFAEVMEWDTEPDGPVEACTKKVLELSGLAAGEVDKQEKN